MEPLLSRVVLRAAPKILRSNKVWTPRAPATWVCISCRVLENNKHATNVTAARHLSTTTARRLKVQEDPNDTKHLSDRSYAEPAVNVSQNVTDAEKDHFERIEEESSNMQVRSPWMREGSAEPPVRKNRSAGAMTKGKLLTTPSRMLKLVLPLSTRDKNEDRKTIEPLALLVHPQQPLSYLERLIQSELPMLEDRGRMRAPDVTFRAQDAMAEDIGSEDSAIETLEDEDGVKTQFNTDNPKEREQYADQLNRKGKPRSTGNDEKDAERLSSEVEDTQHPDFVRWSPSTEIGDFIRDAASGKEFAVDIERASAPIYIAVPSFADRTYYLRMRLRKTAKRISELADLKKDCDRLAQRGARRVAQSGFLALLGWWGAVYYLTFRTDLGWDVMEPVTYLVGLSGLIGGYMWFLYHNREVSYRSAMNVTISQRQNALYERKGFNLPHWESLIEEGNRLRREVKMVADEYGMFTSFTLFEVILRDPC